MRSEFKKRRDFIVNRLKNMKDVICDIPGGAFYVFPNFHAYMNNTIATSNDFCMYLLNNAHVACVSGSAFGNPECIRISYAASDEKLIEAMNRIKNQLGKLS